MVTRKSKIRAENIARIVKQIEACKAAIAAERDKLRDLLSEVTDICDSCDRGVEDLEHSIDALSELL